MRSRELDPSASPLDYYGYELRRARESAGLTLAQLGAVVFCTGSLIGKIETAARVPPRDSPSGWTLRRGRAGCSRAWWGWSCGASCPVGSNR